MKKADLKKYEALLLQKKKQALQEMGIVGEQHMDRTPKESAGDLSSHAYHMADQGTDTMEREMAFMMASKS
ncbi:MAG: TraR/DksA family transcriptional regulator, partial [Candidatus Zixiibacteriota bacterium]